jgi:hypothetical protein
VLPLNLKRALARPFFLLMALCGDAKFSYRKFLRLQAFAKKFEADRHLRIELIVAHPHSQTYQHTHIGSNS